MSNSVEIKGEYAEPELSRALEKEITVVVKPANSRESSDVESHIHQSTQKPTFWTHFPWFGLIGLVTVILCSVASLLVLFTSNGKPASEWCRGMIEPNVLISIFNNLSNFALTVAVGQGIAISWWRRAQAGGTVKQLYYSLAFSESITEIFTKFKYFNMIALTVLVAKCAVIDGILYQKATVPYLDIIRNPRNRADLTTFGATVFPVTGKMGYSRDVNGFMNSAYEAQVTHWDDVREDVDQNSHVIGCDGIDCHYFLQGAGFSMSCTNSSNLVDYGQAARSSRNPTSLVDLPLFAINFTRSWPTTQQNYSAIILDMTYAGTSEASETQSATSVCPINLNRVTCELRPAVLNYKLQYRNGEAKTRSDPQREPTESPQSYKPTSVSNSNKLVAKLNDSPTGVRLDLDCSSSSNDVSYYQQGCGYYDPSWQQVKGVGFVRHADVVEPFSPYTDSTLEGLYLAFQGTLSSQSRLSYATSNTSSNATWHLSTTGILAMASRYEEPNTNSCAYTFLDPLERVMKLVNILTLMTIQNEYLYYDFGSNYSIESARPIGSINRASANLQTVNAEVHYKDTFYSSSRVYMYIALAATLVAVFAIVPIFYGFWELERKVSLGSFEIAHALKGPAFADIDSDHIHDVLRSVGRQRVVYGQTDHTSGQRLGFKIA